MPYTQLHTRIHPLRQYIAAGRGQVYIKREDELSSGITGSKMRKFASLLPWLAAEKPDEVLLIGSPQSNNVAGLLQLLKENGLKARLMLLESNEEQPKGNLLWIYMLHGREAISWVKRTDWPQVGRLAMQYAAAEKSRGRKVIVLPEGCAIAQAIPGAASLADDILRNEKDSHLYFEHLFIDSGTGTAAMGLLRGLMGSNSHSRRHIHLTLVAGTQQSFMQNMQILMPNVAQEVLKYFQGRLHFHSPAIAPSFGSITRTVLDSCQAIARQEGILMDPVYSVKHLATARHIIEAAKPSGNSLVIYSGGSFGLAGFQDKLGMIV